MKLHVAIFAAAMLARCTPDVCTCPAPVTAVCTSVLTPVTTSSAMVVCSSNSATNDAPAGGFPVGQTAVHYRSGGGATCTTQVTVTDMQPPTLSCASLPPVTRTVAGAAVAVPTRTASDACSSHVTVTPSPATTTDRGAVQVMYTATDASGNSATCMGTVNVLNVIPANGLRLVHAEIDTTNTAVTIVWEHPSDSDATSYRVERATSATGPWTSVGTTTPLATRYDDASLPGQQTYYHVVSVLDGIDGGVTAPVRALQIAATTYDLGVQPVPGLNMPANPASGQPATGSAPLKAVVRYPLALANGPYPIVLLLHGNHGNCRAANYDFTGMDDNRDDDCVISNDNTCPAGSTPTPNAEGIIFLAETLASHGYVVASVNANAINCRQRTVGGVEDGFIGERAALLVEHLRRWRTWNTMSAAPFGSMFMGAVDVGHAVLYGHSRGAEAVAEAVGTLAGATDVAGISLAAVFSLAPTNFDDPQPGSVPFATLVPMCDGDVFTYTGVQLYDRTLRNVGDTAPAVQMFMNHADHDFFNTEWRFDDNEFDVPSCEQGEVDAPPVQRRVLEPLVAAWLDEIVPAGATLEPWLHAVGDTPPGVVLYADSAFDVDLRASYSSPTFTRVDNFEGTQPGVTNLLGGAYSSMGGFADSTPAACTGVTTPPCDTVYTIMFGTTPDHFGWPHYNPADAPLERSAIALDWSTGDAVLGTNLGAGASGMFDASTFAALSLRTAARAAPTNAEGSAPVDFAVSIIDAAGHRGTAMASEVAAIQNLYTSSIPRSVLQTVRLALPGLSARSTPPVDLHTLRRIEIAMSATGQSQGSILLTDVEFAQ